ncbi:MAG: nitrogenase component 1 [Clostridiaceae bacterium]
MYEQLKFQESKFSKDPILGCALEGVASVIAGIEDVSVVIHSPQGCAATVATAYDTHEIDFTKRKIGCTRLFESDIIMGATEKLEAMIKEADAAFNTKVMFVVGTCSADIIGEDIEAVCRNMQSQVNSRLIPILSGGFRGNSYQGIDIGLDALFNFIKKEEIKDKNSVNIIAPQANLNPTWWADLKYVTEILDYLGIKVQTVFSHNTSLSEIEAAGKACANILLSHDVGYEFAEKMEKIHGIPLILGNIPLPVGVKNTTQWLKVLAAYFNVEEKAEELIKKGEELVIEILRKRALMIIPRYRNCKVAVSSDSTIGIGLVRMLFEELEMIPEVLLFKSDMKKSQKILNQELNSLGISPKVAFSIDGYQIKHSLKDLGVDAVVGSAWEKYIAEEVGIKIAFDILNPTNREVYIDKPYFGYEGMLNILEVFANEWERAYRSKEINWKECS